MPAKSNDGLKADLTERKACAADMEMTNKIKAIIATLLKISYDLGHVYRIKILQ